MVRLINHTKTNSRVGYLVSLDPDNPHAFVYTTPNSAKCVGVVTESVPYRKPCNIATIGDKTQVYVVGNVNKGDIIRSTQSGDRISLGACAIAKATDSPYLRVGEALTSGRGLVTVVLDLTYQGSDDGAGWVPYIGATQDVNIGDHFLTGRFIVRPGEPAVGLAPIVFLPGQLLTVPVAGTMEFDGTGMYLTPTNHRRFISLASDSIIATVTGTTVAPTTLWTGITNANELKAYRVYVVKACGLLTTHDAADRATITLTLGGTTLISLLSPAGMVTNAPWHMEVYFTIRTTGVAGTFSSHGHMMAALGEVHAVVVSGAINTTIANNIVLTVAWSDTLNSLSLTQAWLATQD